MGAFFVPIIGSGVWVEFEGGNPDYPIWTGGFWADNQLPRSEAGATATAPLKVIRSQKGLMVTLDDASQTLTLSDRDGQNILTIHVEEGKIRIEGARKAVVEAPAIELVENANPWDVDSSLVGGAYNFAFAAQSVV